eukprot:scaffold31086_cov51-Attheya_sp.AAC.1
MTDAAGTRTNLERNTILWHVADIDINININIDIVSQHVNQECPRRIGCTDCLRRSVGEWRITVHPNIEHGLRRLGYTDRLRRSSLWWHVVWCGVVWCRVVSCRQPHLFRRSGSPVRGGVGRGCVAIAFRLRLLSSASLEGRGVALGVVVGVKGAMVSRLLLLIVACYSGVAELG